MKYNISNKRYEIGLGLYFLVTNKHISNPGIFICKSNINLLDNKQLQAETEAEAVIEVTGIIQSELNFVKE